MKEKNIVRLIIRGDIYPDEISEMLSLAPSRQWCHGDFRSGTKIQEKDCGWIFESDMPKTASLADQSKLILDKVRSKSDIRNRVGSDR